MSTCCSRQLEGRRHDICCTFQPLWACWPLGFLQSGACTSKHGGRQPVAAPLSQCCVACRGRPYVIVFVGVNGVGKSTNLAKIAYWLLQNKMTVSCAWYAGLSKSRTDWVLALS